MFRLMFRTYSLRLKPTARQTRQLNAALTICCDLYNAALQERREAWTTQRRSISYPMQCRQLTELRAEDPGIRAIPVDLAREPLRRVRRAFAGFFRRVKAGQKPGYPRFRSRERYSSLAIHAPNFRIEGRTLLVSTLGGFRFQAHRELRGVPKSLTLVASGKKWLGRVVLDVGPAPEKRAVDTDVGIDVGLSSFAVLSDGSEVPNPRFLRKSEEEIARCNRRLARKQRGSRNRRKARLALRRAYERVAGRRRNFCHHISKGLVSQYDLIAFEKLQIREMVGGKLSKSILDAAWGELTRQIAYKAEEPGRWAVPVNPRNTTQACSACGRRVEKSLVDRWHACECGLSVSRDHNAALNILALGRTAAGLLPPKVSKLEHYPVT